MPSRAENPTPPEFEPFLYAEIGKEANGMSLTVASAFARLGLDPWHQAGILARLSDVAATASLAALIGRLELSGLAAGARAETLAIASRLVPLLPKESGVPMAGGESVERVERQRSGLLWLFWGLIAAAAFYVVWF